MHHHPLLNETNRLYCVLDRRLAGHHYVAGEGYTIADMAAYPWIVPWKRQQQDLDNFWHVRRWFNEIRESPATIRPYAKAEAFTQPAVTEEGKKLLFGQTAASTAAT